jgi:hypothetical protein
LILGGAFLVISRSRGADSFIAVRAVRHFDSRLVAACRIARQAASLLSPFPPEVPMYRKVIDSFGLSNNSQGDLGWLHAILVFGDLYDDSADVLTNPASEVVRKLELVANVNPHAITRIKAILAKLELQYAGGQR